ncbi:MAG: GGDEF domain-containing protein [Thiomicrospira sp.]|nr:GGDEF domain-containing protein [Thiomicrospira sp.]PIU39327.1 MAG: GGDEF domain-containing protein [Piscirickettsiaceae bacterium CG07_land_8_20_14_0_80_44_28]PIW58154.1 MAG: GGDEF domain-containing protein [Piscirickettsiaceae bacterium CG12_big_fil_rev_8_21_14_0_65_44_934]PIY77092.1 MAG: GGDEF domain-containing protein [Piscirickettsiaceae bacterium CG_4_10_14_0_8_um_filter_44_742]PIZ74011.1 MAG: GGDEF domain-containing protein [Piscirickettsiaceae bacterium CG_4_10_14_0_2_um_filter_44_33
MKFNANTKIIIMITTLLLVLSVSISLLNFIVSLNAKQQELKHRSLPLSIENIYTEIQRNIIEPNLISSMMAHDTFVKEWLHHQETDRNKIQNYLASIQQKYGMFLTFLVSEKTHNYYSQKGFIEKLNPKDPDNAWYFRFKNQPETHEINLDYNDQFHNSMIMFINHKIYDQNQQLLGATGIGMKMSYIDSILKTFRENYQFTVFFANRQGDIILRERDINPLKNLSDNPDLDKLRPQILSNKGQTLEYHSLGEKYLLKSQFIPELNAYLIVQAKLDDFTKDVRQTFLANLSISLIITFMITLIILTMVRRFNNKLSFLASNDTLTQLKNRRAFNDDFEIMLSLTKRHQQPLSLIFFDIDNFKTINDQYGHQIGDQVLVRVAEILKQRFRKEDLTARWGGEEFVIALPSTTENQAYTLAENLRNQIEQDPQLQTQTQHPVTISLGITEYRIPDDYDSLFRRLDDAMYQAKRNGKNQTCHALI